MASQAAEGQKALADKNYSQAIELYTQALKSSNSPLWLIQRSTAHLRNKQNEEALQDAESAILAAITRGRRELIAKGQMRRAIALHSLQLYGDSRLCFTWVRKLNEKEPGLGMWQAKLAKDYDNLAEDAPGKKVSIKEIPVPNETTAVLAKLKSSDLRQGLENHSTAVPVPATHADMSTLETERVSAIPPQTESSTPSTAPVQTPKDKIRQEFFQTSNKVTITIFAKNVPKDELDIQYNESSLSISFPTATPGVDYDFTALPLYSPIDVTQSSHTVTPNKIEINLHKAKPGLKWPRLEGDTVISTEKTTSIHAPLVSQDDGSNKASTYPTSSRSGPKDWDAVAKQALKKGHGTGNGKDANEITEEGGNGEESDNEGDAMNGFFRKLYRDANPDTRRAMMKSYVESNGTALSTNWDEVGSKTVETSPPEGIEAKKWET